MKRIVLLLSLFSFSACNQESRQYESIIKKVDAIEIIYKEKNKKVVLTNQQLETFKKALVWHIEPEMQQKFISDVNVDLFVSGSRIAFLQIYTGSSAPFANFNSDKLNFGFRLTYSIGMFVDEVDSEVK